VQQKDVHEAGSFKNSVMPSSIGGRWSFAEKLSSDTDCIFCPRTEVKLQYRVLAVLSADSFGESMRIQIKKNAVLDADGAKIFGQSSQGSHND